MNLNELYTQVITENSRSKENRHPVEGATHSLEGVNPSCGDDITLQQRVKDGVIRMPVSSAAAAPSRRHRLP